MQFTRDIRKLLQSEPLDAERWATLWGAVLDGAVDELELGAIVAATTAEPREELAALHRAARERTSRWTPPMRGGFVSIAAYGIVPGEALGVALACALLRRFDVPVVIHGVLDSPCGASTASVLRELGVLPCASLAQADEKLSVEGVAFLPSQLVFPTLAPLIALRSRLGVVNASHLVATMLDPTDGHATRVVLCSGREGERLEALDEEGEGSLVSLRWPEGRSPLNLAIRPRISRIQRGAREVLFEADAQETPTALAPPPEDAAGMAQWIQRATDGSVPVPVPALSLAAACLYAIGNAPDLSRAKAIAAVHAGRMAA